MMSGAFDLRRFAIAQNPVIADVMAELKAGLKRSHWMWSVFPQIAGLGMSAMSQRYAIAGLAEARAYLADQVLGPRLRRCTETVIAVQDRTAEQIFGAVDAQKFHSSITLFRAAAPDEPLFSAALDKYFSGAPDEATLRKL